MEGGRTRVYNRERGRCADVPQYVGGQRRFEAARTARTSKINPLSCAAGMNSRGLLFDERTLDDVVTRLAHVSGSPYPGNAALGAIDDVALTERIYRVDGDELRYEVHIDDPKTYVKPWTLSLPLTSPPGYVLLPYECHEGNYMLKNSLSAERAEDKAIEEEAKKGIIRRRKSVQQNLDAGARPIPGRANPDDQE